MVDGLVVIDMRGTITNYNPNLAKMFGLDMEGLKGQNYRDVFSFEMAESIARARYTQGSAFMTEVDLQHDRTGNAASSAIVIENTVDDANDLSNTVLGTVTLVRDITREKEVDQMKTDFISTVSHELRTPLTSVLGFTKIIKKRLTETILPQVTSDEKKVNRAISQVENNLDIIILEGERLTSLINDVLDIAKMEAGRVDWNMQPTSISELMERALVSTASLFEEKPSIKLIKEIKPHCPIPFVILIVFCK